MSQYQCSEPSPGMLALSGELSVTDAPALKALLVDALRVHTKLEIDLLNVTHLDTSFVQLMLALQRAAAEDGKSLVWLGYSQPVEEVLAILNLSDKLTAPGAVLWG